MTREDYTGYSGRDEDDEDTHQRWWVERYEGMWSSQIHAHVMCNGDVRGTIRVRSEEELEWLKKKLKGERHASENAQEKDNS